MDYKLTGTNYWKSHFNDLKQFDRVGLHEVLYRVDATIKEFDYHNGALIAPKDSYNDISEMKDLYDKFNGEETGQVCFYPDGKSPFRKNYTSKLIDSTSNYQIRDGHIKSPIEHLDLYTNYFKRKENLEISSRFLYLSIPHKFVSEYMIQTNNGWDMTIPKKFINEINNWDDIEYINEVIDEYDKKYENWNHDFPIMNFISIMKNGLLFPNLTFKGNGILDGGTHRLFMCGMTENDYPMLLLPPYNKTRFQVNSMRDIFGGELVLDIDLENKKCIMYVDESEIGEVKV